MSNDETKIILDHCIDVCINELRKENIMKNKKKMSRDIWANYESYKYAMEERLSICVAEKQPMHFAKWYSRADAIELMKVDGLEPSERACILKRLEREIDNDI